MYIIEIIQNIYITCPAKVPIVLIEDLYIVQIIFSSFAYSCHFLRRLMFK